MRALLLTLVLAGSSTSWAGEMPLDRLVAPLSAQGTAAASEPAPPSSYVTPPPTSAAGKNMLDGDELVMALEKQLGEHFATDGEVKLTLLRAWSPVQLASNDWALLVTEWPTSGIASTFFMRFRVMSEGQVVADCQMPLKAQLLQEVWMASGRLERGQSLDRSSLAVQKVNVIGEQSGLLPARLDPSTMEVLQPIPAGRPLTRRDVGVKPVIRKGQVVEALAQQGRLSVRMKALALENGAAGDLIKMRNLESRKDFNGQILNESKVQVHF